MEEDRVYDLYCSQPQGGDIDDLAVMLSFFVDSL